MPKSKCLNSIVKVPLIHIEEYVPTPTYSLFGQKDPRKLPILIALLDLFEDFFRQIG